LDTAYTELALSTLNGFEVLVDMDTVIGRTPHHIWADVTLGLASHTSNIDVIFRGWDLNTGISNNFRRTVEVSKLTLLKTNLETQVKLLFAGSDNQINLSDSNINFSNQRPGFSGLSPLTINVLSGDNSFYNFTGQHKPASTAINLQPGTSLLFDYSGSLSSTASNDDRLYFYTPVTGTVDNATLKLNYSNVYFNSSAFNFTNNSALELTGSSTKAEFKNLSFDTSQMTLDNNTTLVVNDLTLANATMTINSGARVNVIGGLTVTDTTTLDGPGGNGAGLYVGALTLNDNVTFNQNSSIMTATWFFLNSGSQLNIDNAWFSAETIWGRSGTVNITNGGEFVFAEGFDSLSRNATFNIDATSKLRVGLNAEMKMGTLTAVNNTGEMFVDGTLSGWGTISGNGTVYILETGQIAPGDNFNSNNINTITFENSVSFPNVGFLGNYGPSQYYAHIDVVGGTETNDLLQYDDNDFDITLLRSIEVNTASTKTADELHGKSFTIISSLNAGSTGNLITGGSYPSIAEGNDIPALIDFTISNNSTNGNDDITLNATKLGASSFLTHPSVAPSHTLTTTATTAVAPVTGHAITTIMTLVPAQTVPTGTTSTSTTTVAPSTGNTILTTVTVAPNPAGGENHQQTVSTTVTAPTGTVVGQSTQTTQLPSPQTPGTAHNVVTVTATNSSGAPLSSATSTTNLAPSVGSSHTLTTTATTAVAPVTGHATTTIMTLVPAQTVPTGTTSTSTTTVAPSTGNTILTTVTVAPNPTGGENHQQTVSTTVTAPTGTVVGQSTQTTQLPSPQTPGTAHNVVTVTTTNSSGAPLSSATSTSTLEKTTGSDNKTAASNLLIHATNNGNTTISTALNTLTNGQVTTHLDSIHAEPYSSYMTVSLEQIDLVLNSVLSRAAASGGGGGVKADKALKKRFWVDGLGVDGDVDGEDQLGGFGYKLTALTIGQDILTTADHLLGFYFSYGTQKMDEHDIANQDLRADVYHLGMYFDVNNFKAWDIRTVLGYDYGDHESKRYITLGNHTSEVDAEYNSQAIYAGIKASVPWINQRWGLISMELGVNYSYYRQDAFSESGNPDLGLTVDNTSAQSIITGAGLNARFASFTNGLSLHPTAFLKYEHDWYASSNDKHEIDAALISHPENKEAFIGRNRGEHAMHIGIGLSSDVGNTIQINGGVVYSKTSHGNEYGGNINLVYTW
jgi:uncharacterized protein with beta-barrel porin domain